MNVLSLFDGMSCGQIALRELGIKVDNYFASEIDRFAIAQTQLNFPNTIQLGDVRGIHAKDLPRIDLILAGSPCQGFSFAGKQLNFGDPRSALFFEFVRILNECREINPNVKFLLENVRMKKDCVRVISDAIGVKPVMINAALVSAQNRVRLYWSNIRTRTEGLFGTVYTDIPQPQDRSLILRDVLDDLVDAKYYLSEKMCECLINHNKKQIAAGRSGFIAKPKSLDDKMNCLHVGGGAYKDDIVIVQQPHGYNQGRIISGKAPCLTSSGWERNNIVCTSSTQPHATVVINKSTPLVAAMGMGDGHVPMVIAARKVKQINPGCANGGKQPYQQDRVYDDSGLSPALCAAHAGSNPIIRHNSDSVLRRITPAEAARLQTVPEWYKWECSETQQYKMLGNGWCVEVIKHILSYLG